MTDPQNRQPRPDIADVELTVEQLRREGLCIFRSDDKRHWTAKEDAGPLATIGGFHTRARDSRRTRPPPRGQRGTGGGAEGV